MDTNEGLTVGTRVGLVDGAAVAAVVLVLVVGLVTTEGAIDFVGLGTDVWIIAGIDEGAWVGVVVVEGLADGSRVGCCTKERRR